MRYVVIFLMHSSKELAMTTLPILLMLEEDRMKRRKRDNASSSLMMTQSSQATPFKPKPKLSSLRSDGKGNQDKITNFEMLVIDVVKEEISR